MLKCLRISSGVLPAGRHAASALGGTGRRAREQSALDKRVCVCVCVSERERERERAHACVAGQKLAGAPLIMLATVRQVRSSRPLMFR